MRGGNPEGLLLESVGPGLLENSPGQGFSTFTVHTSNRRAGKNAMTRWIWGRAGECMSNKFSDDVGPGQHLTGFGSLTDLGSYPSFATYWLSNLGRVTVTSEPAEGGQECPLGRVPVRIRWAHLCMAPSSLSGNPVSRSQGQSQLRQLPAMHPGASFFLSLSLSFFFL